MLITSFLVFACVFSLVYLIPGLCYEGKENPEVSTPPPPGEFIY